jgi:hypothetical protein
VLVLVATVPDELLILFREVEPAGADPGIEAAGAELADLRLEGGHRVGVHVDVVRVVLHVVRAGDQLGRLPPPETTLRGSVRYSRQ